MKLEELSRLLKETDPAAVLVSGPVLARVVQNVARITWTVWSIPHSRCFVIDRATLYKHVEQEELALPPDHLLPPTVLLLERPSNDELNDPKIDIPGRYWRLLFHATLDRELSQRLTTLTPAELRSRVERIGPAAFEEARNVLVQDSEMIPTGDDKAAYIEFAASYLELRYFAPNLIPVYFPSLPPVAEVEAILAADVDGEALFKQTRLDGAANPTPRTDDQSDESHDYYEQLTRAARRAGKISDTVGAAILHTRAARVAPASRTKPAQDAARKDIHHLIKRLQDALGLTELEADSWRKVLPALLDKADQGARPVEAALLYDLQRACMDHEQTIYTLDVPEWLLSAGHKPIKRPLDSQKFVRVPAQLRNATRRLAAARLTDADRRALAVLLQEALNRSEDRLRQRFRPVLTDALRDAGLQPTTLPEQAALSKTVEELLDRISSAGFLGFADVRDAIARGQMKLPDLAGPNEYVRGDPLLRLDRRLASLLDGVYRRAESYTRALERVTAFNFGTQTGRWLTRNFTFPFGGALLIAQFIWMLVFDARCKAARKAGESEPSFFSGWNLEPWFHLAWFALGLGFLATIRSARVRGWLTTALRTLYRGARYLVWDLPIRIANHPMVRAALATVPVQLGLNYVVKPLAVSGVVWAAFYNPLWSSGWPARIVTLVASIFVVNSRIGRAAEAILLELARSLLEILRSFPAILRWLSDLFRELVYALEWTLARIEDGLRLRGKGGPFAVTTRAIASVIWMPFAFLIRFYTVVLIEPMVNPLKLPLSILFAKLVYPLLLLFPGVLRESSNFLGYDSPLVDTLSAYISTPGAWLLVMGTLWLLPDACTFLFWEMRENWRLYRANRPTALRPVSVGPHGETVKALLYYGIHSGTVPRLYGKLREAEREAARTDVWRAARTHRQALRGVEEAVRHFVLRDFIEVLNNPDAGWGGPKLGVGHVNLGTNRIRIEIVPEWVGKSAWLEWEDRSGWLVAGWAETGFLAELPAESVRPFGNALAYLYKRAGIDVIREQVRAELPKNAVHFDIAPDGMLVWYDSREAVPLLYDLAEPVDELRSRSITDLRPVPGPTLNADQIIYRRVSLTWSQWVGVWQIEPSSETRPRLGPADWEMSLLPQRVKTHTPGSVEPSEEELAETLILSSKIPYPPPRE